MLANILKNTILVVLIISIGFFLIDNHLQEMSSELRYLQTTESSCDEVGKSTQEQIAKAAECKPNGKSVIKTLIEDAARIDETSKEKIESECEGDDVAGKDDMPSSTNNFSRAMKLHIDDNMKEIYDYVYGDDEASEQLANMYDKPEVPLKDAVCASNPSEKQKVKDMCDDPIERHQENVSYEFIEMPSSATNRSLINLVEDATVVSKC